MPRDDVDFATLFAPLRAAADQVPIGSGKAARAVGDRQARRQTVSILVVLAMLVGGVTIPLTMLIDRDRRPGGIVTPSTSSPPAPTPTPAVDCTSTGELNPGLGTPEPASRMLSAADIGSHFTILLDIPGYQPYQPCGYVPPAPNICQDQAPYPADAFRTGGRLRTFTGGIESGAFEVLTTYSGEHAVEFMDEVRARIASCATFRSPDASGQLLYARIAETRFAGDDSLLIYIGTSPTIADTYPLWWYGVVRIGGMVIVVEDSSDLLSHRDFVRAMAITGAQRAGG